MLTLERRWTRTQTAALLVVQTQRAQNKIDEKEWTRLIYHGTVRTVVRY